MITLKKFKEELLARGKEHTVVLNNVTYKLVVNKMLILCKWNTPTVKSGGSNMFSNAYTLDEVASYMKNICNKLTDDQNEHIHHRRALDELMALIPENEHVSS